MNQANQRKLRAKVTKSSMLLAAAAASGIGLNRSARGANATWSAAPTTSNWNFANWVGGSGALGQACAGRCAGLRHVQHHVAEQ